MVETFEKVQGLQGDHIILDITTSSGMRFFTDPTRINTAVSRGIAGVLIIGSFELPKNRRAFPYSPLGTVCKILEVQDWILQTSDEFVAQSKARYDCLLPSIDAVVATDFDEEPEEQRDFV